MPAAAPGLLLAGSGAGRWLLFTDLDKLVLDYAIGMSRTPVEVSDAGRRFSWPGRRRLQLAGVTIPYSWILR